MALNIAVIMRVEMLVHILAIW